ncbi:MAG: hypothetical protein M3Y89_16280, partial [Actinomycetota bacterium]|nr:hypothetical protein [Actinomycetota bacterium]
PTGLSKGAKARIHPNPHTADSLNFWIGWKKAMLIFSVWIDDHESGGGQLYSQIDNFRTSQNAVGGFIPAGRSEAAGRLELVPQLHAQPQRRRAPSRSGGRGTHRRGGRLMLYLLILVGVIGLLYGISLVVHLFIDGASRAADRALHKRDRRQQRYGDE